MKKLQNLSSVLYANEQLSQDEQIITKGGLATGGGSKTLGGGGCDSAVLSWGSDDSSGGGTTYSGSSTCGDEHMDGLIVAIDSVAKI
jgi:hypothetical protein